jgi:hypothetical protein
MVNGEWWDPGRGGSQTRPGCVVAPASCPRPIARGDGRGHSRTPICPTGKGRGTACRALTVTGVSQPPFVDTHLTVRMANREWRMVKDGQQRAASGERRKTANGEWEKTANGEWWDPGRGGFSTRPAATWRGFRKRFQTRASALGHPRMRSWTPISVGEQGSVRNREWRIANGEWWGIGRGAALLRSFANGGAGHSRVANRMRALVCTTLCG